MRLQSLLDIPPEIAVGARFFKWLNSKRAFHLLVIIGTLTYFNSLFNSYVLDDFDVILGNPLIRSPKYLLTYFTYSSDQPLIDAVIKQIGGSFYRPLNLVFFMLLHPLLGPQPLVLNLLLVSIYIINTCLLFSFFNKFFKVSISFILSLIFLVHPINVETVSHIGSADLLFFFFGIFAINKLFSENFGKLNKLLVFLFFLFSIFSKETGILFLILACVFTLIFEKKRFKFTLIFSVVILSIYSLLRFLVARPVFYKDDYSYILNASLTERIITVPSIVFYYLQNLIFPKELGILQTWVISTVDFKNFFLPLLIILTIFLFSIYFIFNLKKTNKHLYILGIVFSLWFVLGMLPHLSIFYSLTATVAPRWFYFPFIGVLGLCGVAMEGYKWPSKQKNIFFILFCVVILIFIIRTNVRILNWRNNLTLFEHDIKTQKESYPLISNLTSEYIDANRLDEAEKLLFSSIKKDPKGWVNWTNLGNLYVKRKNYKKAAYYFERAIENKNDYEAAYVNYSILLLMDKKPQKAKDLIEILLKRDPVHFRAWRILAISYKELGNKEKALDAAKKANSLYLDNQGIKLYTDLLMWAKNN